MRHLRGLSRWPWGQRLKARWWLWRNLADELNRRAKVERYLWDVFQGKQPPVDPGKAKELALMLGRPTSFVKRLEEQQNVSK